MIILPFKQIDVFSTVPFRGNPLAVIFKADGLSGTEMQAIANWTNLSETTFIQTSQQADYRLKIFAPDRELPFAGHPTIGSAHALREAGIIPRENTAFVQECEAGLIPITVKNGDVVFVRVPKPRILSSFVDHHELREAIKVDSCMDGMVINVGPTWMVTRVESCEHLYNLTADTQRLADLSHQTDSVGLSVYAVENDKEVHVRSFAPAVGILEDPVCGSGNAVVAAHIRATDLQKTVGSSYTAHQGRALDRDGHIEVRLEGEEVLIGGRSTTVIDGEIRL